MAKRLFLLRKRFWINLSKVVLLTFVGGMVLVQIPELIYDFGSKQPVSIQTAAQLNPENLGRKVFAAVNGTGSFENAFIYERYGLSYTYFNVEPYGLRMVVRTFEGIDDTWRARRQFLGKLRPFEDQPFSYAIRAIYLETFSVEIPEGAYFLALEDVPAVSGWQLGAAIFAAVMWGVMFYMFFFFGPLRSLLSNDTRPGQSNGGKTDSAVGEG